MKHEVDISSAIAAAKEKKALNKPFRTPGGPKKFSVYVKNDKGNVVKVNFGDPNMEIKRDDPNRRKNFRARHNCENPGPKWKARYWSCKMWSAKPVSKLTSRSSEETQNYMFFANLKTIKSAVDELLAMDERATDVIISDGHDWAADHIAEAKTNIEQVYHFFETKKDSPESMASEEKTHSLNQLSDYYYEKPVLVDPNEDWDGYSFYSEEEILKAMPELRNVDPTYDDDMVVNNGPEYPYDSPANPERKCCDPTDKK